MECIAKKDKRLGPFGSNILRGKFGAEFRRLVCLRPSSNCLNCSLRTSCPYAVVFETSPPPLTKVMRKYNSAPRPFIIYFPFKSVSFNEGERMTIELTLVGKANDYLPYFAYCFLNILKRLDFELVSLSCDGENLFKGDSVKVPTGDYNYLSFSLSDDYSSFSVELLFESPLRLVFNEELQSLPSFPALMRSFFRRIVLLDYFHCGGDGEYPFKEVLELLDGVNMVDFSISEGVFERFSHRQKRRIPLYGVTGKARYEPIYGFLLPYLRAMRDIHVGKNTTFGFGKVALGDVRPLG